MTRQCLGVGVGKLEEMNFADQRGAERLDKVINSIYTSDAPSRCMSLASNLSPGYFGLLSAFSFQHRKNTRNSFSTR